MADNIEIKIEDRVSTSVSQKLKTIATEARNAHNAIETLKRDLESINVGGLSRLTQELNKTSTAQSKLTRSSDASAASYLKQENALNRAIVAEQQAATAAQRLATEQNRTAQAAARVTVEENRAAQAAQRLATEQQRTAIQTANAAAAKDRASLAAQRLEREQQKAADTTQRLSSRLMSLRGVIATVVSALGIRAFANLTSELTDIESAINRLTGSADRTEVVMGRLTNMARRTYSSFNETASSFARNSTTLDALGYSIQEQLDYTESLNNALVISAAKGNDAALVQNSLSRAMAEGTMRGQELDIVLNYGSRIAEALAENLGVNVTQLRALAKEGKITSAVLYESLAGSLERTREEADAMPATINDGMLLIKNAVVSMVSDFDKMFGISEKVADGLVWVADNLRLVTVLAAGAGAALLMAYGPSLVGMLGTATGALKAFTLVLASNPIGLILVALSTAVAYLVVFREELNAGIDSITTVGDLGKAAFQLIGEAVDSLIEDVSGLYSSIVQAVGGAFDFINPLIERAVEIWNSIFGDFFETSHSGWLGLIEFVLGAIDKLRASVLSVGIFISRMFGEVIRVVQNSIAIAYNAVMGWIESITNAAINAANRMRAMVGKSAIELVQFERLEGQGASEFESMGAMWAQSLEDGFRLQGDTLTGVLDAVVSRAQELAVARSAIADTDLGGNKPKFDSASGDRAKGMREVNEELDREISRLFILQPLREQMAKFDEIEKALKKDGITLSKAEADALRDKIKALHEGIEVQKQFDAIYSESVNPLKEYNATLIAASKLLEMGAISQADYAKATLRASEAYENIIDPMRQYNKDLEQQFELLQMLPRQREIEQQIMQVQNDLLSKGIELTGEETEALRAKLKAIENINRVQQQETALLSQGIEARNQFIDQLKAIENLRNNANSGFSSGDESNAVSGMLAGMGVDTSTLQVGIDAQLAVFANYYEQLNQLREADLISEQDYANAKMQIALQESQMRSKAAKELFGELSNLQSSSIREFAIIGKAAAITQATINTYEGATKALAQGGIMGPVMAAAVIASGMAQVASIRAQNAGFKEGGYTGNLGVNEVAGAVHGQEYVFDAAATSRIGVSSLEALRSGAAQVQQGASGQKAAQSSSSYNAEEEDSRNSSGSGLNVRIVNLVDKQLLTDYLATSEGEQAIMNLISRNSDNLKQVFENG